MDAVRSPAAERAAWTVALSEDDVLTIIAHLLSSAELCLNEPQLYGSFRLLDATSRLAGLLLGKGAAGHDAFLAELKEEIDRKKVLMMYDPDAYAEFVQQAPVLVAARLKERFQREGGQG